MILLPYLAVTAPVLFAGLSQGQIFKKSTETDLTNAPLTSESITIPEDYYLSFNIRPILPLSSSPANVLHVASSGDPSRMPAVFLTGDRLKFVLSKEASGWTNQPNVSLPLNGVTRVGLTARGRSYTIHYNSTVVATGITPGARPKGPASFYMPDPWSDRASAKVSNLEFHELFVNESPYEYNVTKKAVPVPTSMPTRFYISFLMKPYETSEPWTNVIHYTALNSNCETDCTASQRMPAFWMIPGSSKLQISLGSNTDPDYSVTSATLPLLSFTRVALVGEEERTVKLYLNGTLGGTFTLPSDRVNGSTNFYVSNPWYSPAKAILQDYSLQSWTSNSPVTDAQIVREVYSSLSPLAANIPSNGCLIPGVTCTASGQVTAIDWADASLTGPIPSLIGRLTSLKTLNLNANPELSGQIPLAIGNLVALESLYLLGVGKLSGVLPSTLCNLKNLKNLEITDTTISSQIPFCLGTLTRLQTLVLSDNQLTGSIPSSLGGLSSLLTLSIENNKLEGGIPATLGNIKSLLSLELQLNQLSGPIPSSLGSLVNLETIRLESNSLTSIPDSLLSLTRVKDGKIYPNPITGAVPSLSWA